MRKVPFKNEQERIKHIADLDRLLDRYASERRTANTQGILDALWAARQDAENPGWWWRLKTFARKVLA